jgi:hypothetical protein
LAAISSRADSEVSEGGSLTHVTSSSVAASSSASDSSGTDSHLPSHWPSRSTDVAWPLRIAVRVPVWMPRISDAEPRLELVPFHCRARLAFQRRNANLAAT